MNENKTSPLIFKNITPERWKVFIFNLLTLYEISHLRRNNPMKHSQGSDTKCMLKLHVKKFLLIKLLSVLLFVSKVREAREVPVSDSSLVQCL